MESERSEPSPFEGEVWFVVGRGMLIREPDSKTATLGDDIDIASGIARGRMSAFMFTSKALAKDFIKRSFKAETWTAISPQSRAIYTRFLRQLKRQGYTHLLIDEHLQRSVARALRLAKGQKSS
jgi:hypothetical protein